MSLCNFLYFLRFIEHPEPVELFKHSGKFLVFLQIVLLPQYLFYFWNFNDIFWLSFVALNPQFLISSFSLSSNLDFNSPILSSPLFTQLLTYFNLNSGFWNLCRLVPAIRGFLICLVFNNWTPFSLKKKKTNVEIPLWLRTKVHSSRKGLNKLIK